LEIRGRMGLVARLYRAETGVKAAIRLFYKGREPVSARQFIVVEEKHVISECLVYAAVPCIGYSGDGFGVISDVLVKV